MDEFDKMVEFDKRFWDITKGMPVPLVPGSLFRLHHSNMEAWGVDIRNCREKARERSRKFMAKDDREIENLGPEIIESLFATESRKDTENTMGRLVASFAVDIIKEFNEISSDISVMDFGARYGKATRKLIVALNNDAESDISPDNIDFHLVETSDRMAKSANENLSNLYGIDTSVHSVPCGNEDRESIIAKMEKNSFDVIITLSSMHHHSFPDYLKNLNRILKPGGVLVSGDWYSTAWEDPNWGHYLLKYLGANEERRRNFLDFLGLDEKKADNTHLISARNLDPQGTSLNIVYHLKHWAELKEKITSLYEPLSGIPRRYFLSAHTSVEKRCSELETAGFEVNMGTIKKAFPKSNLPSSPKRAIRECDFATVLIAMKKGRR